MHKKQGYKILKKDYWIKAGYGLKDKIEKIYMDYNVILNYVKSKLNTMDSSF